MASGHTNLKQLLFVLLPVVIVWFLAIAFQQSGTRQMFDNCSHKFRIGLHGPLHIAFFAALGLIGVSFTTINLLTGNVFTSNGCIDPFINTTLAAVEADTVFQFCWVALNGFSIALSGLIYRAVVRGDSQKQALATQRWLSTFAVQAGKRGAEKEAIAVWCGQMPVPVWRKLLSFALHVPCICLAVSPAVAYVSGRLVNAGKQVQLCMGGVGAGCKFALWEWLVRDSFR